MLDGLISNYLKLLVFSLSLGSLAACQTAPNSPIAQTAEVPSPSVGPSNQSQGTGGGIIDSSGGNLNRSSDAEVKEAIRQLPFRLSLVLNRVRMYMKEGFQTSIAPSFLPVLNLEEDDLPPDFVPTISRRAAPSTNPKLSEKFLENYFEAFNPFDLEAPELAESRFIKIKLVEGDCQCKVKGARDAAANTRGEICFSLPRLRQIPAISLPVATTALGAHELAHVLNLEEDDAQAIQDLIEWNRDSLFFDSKVKKDYLKTIGMFEGAYSNIMDLVDKLPEESGEEPSYEDLRETHERMRNLINLMKQGLRDLVKQGDKFFPVQKEFDIDLLSAIESFEQRIIEAQNQEVEMEKTGLEPAEALKLKHEFRWAKAGDLMISESRPIQNSKEPSQDGEKKKFKIEVNPKGDGAKPIQWNTEIHPSFRLPRMSQQAQYEKEFNSISDLWIEITDSMISYLYGVGLTDDQLDLLRAYETLHPEVNRILSRVDELKLFPDAVEAFDRKED